MTVYDISQKMDLKVFTMEDPEREIHGAYCGDLLSWVMGRAEFDNAWFTIMSNQNVAAVAVMAELSCVILTEGVSPDPELLEKAAREHINLLGTDLPTFEAASKFSGCIE